MQIDFVSHIQTGNGDGVILPLPPEFVSVVFWAKLLKKWRAESKCVTHEEFDTWLYEVWTVKLITNSTIEVGAVSGISIDDKMATMLLLKYSS